MLRVGNPRWQGPFASRRAILRQSAGATMAANVKHKPSQSNSDSDAAEDRALLVAIEEQGRQTLELLRALVALLTPKEGGREGPSLEELLTTIIMQGREQIGILKTIQEEQIRSAETLPQAVADAVLEQLGPARHARS